MPDLALGPRDEIELASGCVPTHVDELLERNRMALEAVGREGVDILGADHARRL